MTFAYGAFKPEQGKTLDMFAVRVEVDDPITPPFEHTRPIWPYHVVTLYNNDTTDRLVSFEIMTIPGKTIDESNVFDIMEYMLFNYGRSPTINASPYDLTFPFSKGNGVHHVTLRRAIGCRHFIFHVDGRVLNITASGPGIEDKLTRHEIPHVLLVKTKLDFEVGAWTSGINGTGFNLTFYEKGNVGGRPTLIYNNPLSFDYTPKQIARIQMMTAKRLIEDHKTIAKYTGDYSPHRFRKVVLSDKFWYLKSLDGNVLITLMDRPAAKAMEYVMTLINDLSKEDKQYHSERYLERLNRNMIEYSGKDQDKAIVLDCIDLAENIQSSIDRQVTA